ncbi:MAG: cyclic nucleotide-binding domain-containing protein [Desulfatiglandales bacterium]
MTNQTTDTLTPFRLHYRKGDLIVKEGDYGISMYKILSGKIQVLVESGDLEIPLATLEEGDVLGEMIFLHRNIERRTATARALEDSELEVWHPDMIAREYEELPAILKRIADQALVRLKRMNKFIPRLIEKGRVTKIPPKPKDPWASQRRFYRKKVGLPVVMKATKAVKGGLMEGEVRDLSLGGAGVEIRPKNPEKFPYKEGHVCEVQTTLPNGKEIVFKAEIRSVRRGDVPGALFLGLSIVDIDDRSNKDLGFFLMPA